MQGWDLFAGWSLKSCLEGSYEQKQRDACLQAVNWEALLQHASRLKNSMKCQMLPRSTMGGCHLVQLLEFEDESKWIVRFPLDPPTPTLAKQIQTEVDTMSLITSRTKIPVPQILASDPHGKTGVGVPFIIMEYLPGIVAMDADGGHDVHHGAIAPHRKPEFFRTFASIQVEMASVRMPKIGSIFRRDDGTYDVGPLPELGGPFDTATAFFKAWAARAKFPSSEDYIRKIMEGGPLEEVLTSIKGFPALISALAGQLSSHNEGPFPVYHRDLYQSNIVVNANFDIIGLIDWQDACTVPWELVEFPLFLSTVPRAMDVAWNYDEDGQHKVAEVRLTRRERAEYIALVRAAESSNNRDTALSQNLANADIQALAYAIKVYHDPGKMGFYLDVLEPFRPRDGTET